MCLAANVRGSIMELQPRSFALLPRMTRRQRAAANRKFYKNPAQTLVGTGPWKDDLSETPKLLINACSSVQGTYSTQRKLKFLRVFGGGRVVVIFFFGFLVSAQKGQERRNGIIQFAVASVLVTESNLNPLQHGQSWAFRAKMSLGLLPL